jgi:hypothetical protein
VVEVDVEIERDEQSREGAARDRTADGIEVVR